MTLSSRARRAELRRKPRKLLHCPAKIDLGGGAPLPCLLWGVSESGARITVGDPTAPPEDFTLLLADESRRLCRIIWRGEQQIGVRYIDAPASPAH